MENYEIESTIKVIDKIIGFTNPDENADVNRVRNANLKTLIMLTKHCIDEINQVALLRKDMNSKRNGINYMCATMESYLEEFKETINETINILQSNTINEIKEPASKKENMSTFFDLMNYNVTDSKIKVPEIIIDKLFDDDKKMFYIETPKQTYSTTTICKYLAYCALTDKDFLLHVISRNPETTTNLIEQIKKYVLESKFTKTEKENALQRIVKEVTQTTNTSKYLYIDDFEFLPTSIMNCACALLRKYNNSIFNGEDKRVIIDSSINNNFSPCKLSDITYPYGQLRKVFIGPDEAGIDAMSKAIFKDLFNNYSDYSREILMLRRGEMNK